MRLRLARKIIKQNRPTTRPSTAQRADEVVMRAEERSDWSMVHRRVQALSQKTLSLSKVEVAALWYRLREEIQRLLVQEGCWEAWDPIRGYQSWSISAGPREPRKRLQHDLLRMINDDAWEPRAIGRMDRSVEYLLRSR